MISKFRQPVGIRQSKYEAAVNPILELMAPGPRHKFLLKKLLQLNAASKERGVDNAQTAPSQPTPQPEQGPACDELELWWFHKLKNGRLLRSDNQWEQVILVDDLLRDYMETFSYMFTSQRAASTSLGRLLHRVHPRTSKPQRAIQTEVGIMRKYFYVLPDLDTARQQWEKKFGPVSWGNE